MISSIFWSSRISIFAVFIIIFIIPIIYPFSNVPSKVINAIRSSACTITSYLLSRKTFPNKATAIKIRPFLTRRTISPWIFSSLLLRLRPFPILLQWLNAFLSIHNNHYNVSKISQRPAYSSYQALLGVPTNPLL